jgi:hypothetical protein
MLKSRPAIPVPRIALLVISPLIAIVFAVMVLWNERDATDEAYTTPPTAAGDLAFLIAGGRWITSDEASSLYAGRQGQEERQWSPRQGYYYPNRFPYPPTTTYLFALFRPFDLNTSADIWRVGVAAASVLLGICVASAFRSWAWRIAIVVGVVLWHPVLMNARINQTGVYIAAATAVAALIFLRRQQLGAVLFGLISLKPTALIGPTLIVVQSRRSVWLAFLATCALIVLVPFIWLGSDAFFDWLHILRVRGWRDIGGGHSYNQGLSSFFGASSAFFLVLAIAGLVLAALATRFVQARLGVCVGMAFAVLAGYLLNPHSLFYDWGTAFVAIMLLRKSDLVSDRFADLVFGLVFISLFVTGQRTWELRHEGGDFLRPLTGWSIAASIGLLLLAVQRWDRFRQLNFGWPSRPARVAADGSVQRTGETRAARRRRLAGRG